MNTNTTTEYLPTQAAFIEQPHTRRKLIRGERIGPAFWTITSVLSLVVNVILIVVLVVLASNLFAIKRLVNDQLIGGLYDNFVLMDNAHIRTTIPVKTSVPAKFDLPLKTNTTVILTKDTPVNGARVSLNGGYVNIYSAPTNIILPAGSQLPVQLDLTVPVDQQIPVELTVNVDIPLNQTELHQPFTGLQQVIGPYHTMLDQLPNSWTEIYCGQPPAAWCKNLFK